MDIMRWSIPKLDWLCSLQLKRKNLYSQEKQDLELTVAQIMNSLLKNPGLSWKSRKNHYAIQFSSVQSLSHVRLCDPMNRSTPGLPVHHQFPEFTQTHIHRVSDAKAKIDHLILCHPLLLPSIFPNIRVFSNESALRIRWPKYWSFSFNISCFNEYPGPISLTMDWLDFLAVQGTLKSLLQHHSSKASIILCWTLFIVQLLHPYMTTGKTIALTRWTFVDIQVLPKSNPLWLYSGGDQQIQGFRSGRQSAWRTMDGSL